MECAMLTKSKSKSAIIFILICSFIFSGCIKGCKKSGNEAAKSVYTDKSKNAEVKFSDADLILMGDNALGEGNTQGIPDYTYNKAISYYRQVTENFPETFNAVEAQFKIAKYTEEKIKYQNSVEIQFRQKQTSYDKNFSFELNIKPFLKSYTPAINEYLKLHLNRKTWMKLENTGKDMQREKAYTRTTDALLRAANLLCDETNPRMDRPKSIEIYNLIIDKYSASGFSDLAFLNIINVYYDLKDWQQVINYGTKFKSRFPQSSYFVDIDQKMSKANSFLYSK